MSSSWRHSLCDACYQRLMPGRIPVRLVREVDICCGCGERHASGIVMRASPFMPGLVCRGQHDGHTDSQDVA